MLKKYGGEYGAQFVDSPEEADLIFTNDVFPEHVLDLGKPKVKRMDGVFWREDLKDRNAPYNQAALQADHVIFISEFSRNSLLGLYPEIKLKSSSVAVNWADEELFKRHETNFFPQNFVAIATSWEREEKRLVDLLIFAEQILKGQLILIGNLRYNVLPSNVSSLGYLEYNELASILERMDALVNFSYRDAAPKVIPEAICCGLPVLYADSGGTSEMVGYYGTPISDP